MDRLDVPFNISILVLNAAKLEGIRPITSTDLFDGQSKEFHPDGLFSTVTFGRVGDEIRQQRYSYIDVRIPIFHPVVFRALTDLKRLYAGIINGSEKAVWDPETKDFEKATATDGKTGFQFFLQHWKQIEFAETKSASREQNILLIKKYADIALTSKVVVMPAGLRELEIDGGRVVMDDINSFYRKLLSTSQQLSDSAVRNNPETLNTARWVLQVAFNQLYDYIESLVKGKKKLLLSGWASRAVFNSTRNVITAMDTTLPTLDAPGYPDMNTTIAGLYQSAKAALPVSIFGLKTGFLSKVFTHVGQPAALVNAKTLKREEVKLGTSYFDRFMTDEGLEKTITSYGVEDIRHKPLMIEGRYLGLIYKGPDMTYRFMQDIDELPEHRDRNDVHPITFTELLYLSIQSRVNGLPALVTRYPITGVGSIYPSNLMVQPTIKYEVRRELDDQWLLAEGEAHIARHFPVTGSAFINSTIPHSSKLVGLSADFDGDTSSLTVLYSDESIREVREFLNSTRAYIGTDGNFMSAFDTDTVGFVFHNLTSPVSA
jgi:hypothetical protein